MQVFEFIMKKLLLWLMLLMPAVTGWAQDITELKERADIHINNGQFNDFIKDYEQLLNIMTKSDIDSCDYAYCLYNIAVGNYLCEKYEDALKLHSQVLKITKNNECDKAVSYFMSLKSIAECYDKMNNYEEAKKYYSNALEVINDEDDVSDLTIAHLYQKLNKYDEAVDYYSRAFEIIRSDSMLTENAIYILYQIAQCYAGQHKYEAAIKSYESLLNFMEDSGVIDVSYVTYWIKMINCYRDRAQFTGNSNDFRTSIELYENLRKEIKSLNLSHSILRECDAVVQNNVADCFKSLNEYSKAVKIYSEIENEYKDIYGEEDTCYAKVLYNYATCLHFIGNEDQAINRHLKAIKIQENKLGQNDINLALTLTNVAVCYARKKEYPTAIKYAEKALNIQRKNHDPSIVASLINLANYYSKSGRSSDAGHLLSEARELIDDDERPLNGALLNQIAIHLANADAIDSAKIIAKQALDIFKNNNGGVNDGCFESLWILFSITSVDMNKSFEYFKEMIDVQYKLINRNLGNLTVHNREAYWNNNSWTFQIWYPFVVWMSRDTSSTCDLYDKSCLFAKGLLLATEMEMRDLVRESGDPVALEKFDRLQGLRSVLNQQYTKPKEERLPDIKTMEDEAERLEQELMGMVSAYGDLMRNLKLTWRDVQSKLGESDVAVEFLSFPVAGDTTQYIALTVRKDYASPHLVGLFTSAELDAAKDCAYTDHGLSRLVWGRMSTELEGVKNIYFSPSGELHNIGIESVPHWSDDCLMSDRFDLYRLSSTRELAMVRNAVSSRGAIVYGGIKFDTSVPTMVSKSGKVGDEAHSMSDIYAMHVQKDRLARNLQESRDWKINDLPGTMTEAESVHKQLKSKLKKQDVVLLTGSDATEESFKRLSGNRDCVIHIATHGMYLKTNQASGNRRKQQLSFLLHDDAGQGFTEDESLSRSCLLFSGARNTFNGADVKVPDSIDDGVLTAQEVSRLDLRGLDLLVLSACQTGLGDVTADGVMGLQRGFKKAGAQSIVMSLWSVDDAATRDMMEQFYKQLKPDLSNKREAFLNAQQDVRKNDGQYKYSNNPEIDARLRKTRPHWAAFILLDALK